MVSYPNVIHRQLRDLAKPSPHIQDPAIRHLCRIHINVQSTLLLSSSVVDWLCLTFAVEQIPIHIHTTSLRTRRLFNEHARSLVPEKGSPEGRLNIGFVVLAHHFLDVKRGFGGVVEGNGGDEVVADVRADDVVEKMGVNETEVAVDGCSGTAGEGPG